MTNTWFDEHRLFHYTTSPAIVRSILDVGFLLVPNRRGLIQRFLPDDDFSHREPQQFGMTCFTELRTADARAHREQFGEFAIGVTWDWALRNGAQRVIYVGSDDGAVFRALRWLFRFARQELKRLDRTDGMAVTNKVMAGGIGAEMYHALLTLYEYMEPERNSSQVEWRIVEKTPIYHRGTTREQLVNEVLEMARVWDAAAVKIEPQDVEVFVCPSGGVRTLRDVLPDGYREVPIYPLTRTASLVSVVHAVKATFRDINRRRERVVPVRYEPPPGSVLLPIGRNGTAVLPYVARMMGVALQPSSIEADRWLDFQYTGEDGKVYELPMPIPEARQLLGYLLHMERIGWRAPYE